MLWSVSLVRFVGKALSLKERRLTDVRNGGMDVRIGRALSKTFLYRIF